MKIKSKRVLSDVESIMYYITTHKKCFNNMIIVFLEAEGLTKGVIEKSLRIIQQNCVELRSIIRENTGKPCLKKPQIPRYEMVEPESIPTIPIYTEKYNEHFNKRISQINGENFPLNHPIMQLFLFEHETDLKTKALAVYFNHAFGDATSTDHFIDCLLNICTEVLDGKEEIPVLSGLEYQKPLSEWLGKRSFKESLKINGDILKAVFEKSKHDTLTDIPAYEKVPFNERSAPQVHMFELTGEGVKSLGNRVKQEHFTLNDVFIGGVAKALSNVIIRRKKGDNTTLKISYPVDLRKRMEPHIPGESLIMAVNNRTMEVNIRKDSSIWEIADKVKDDVARFLKEIWKFKIITLPLYRRIFGLLMEKEKDMGSMLLTNRGLSILKPIYGEGTIKLLHGTFTGCNLLTLTGGPIVFLIMGMRTSEGIKLSMTVNWYKPWMTEETWKELSDELIDVANIKSFDPLELINLSKIEL